MVITIIIACFCLMTSCSATVRCPPNKQGEELICAFACCRSLDSTFEDYFCCGLESKNIVTKSSEFKTQDGSVSYVTSVRFDQKCKLDNVNFLKDNVNFLTSNFRLDYTLTIIALIVSILISVLCSLFCCLLCNGCWLHRRRNPEFYESVENQFYPLCCGFGIPTGTIVFSTHPPQFREESEMYQGSSSTSSFGNRSRVRFNEDGSQRGVLKKSSHPPSDS
ncbi:unnamed protein product [Thelazia callipaeda]|uniref:Uncharacterized protein n=1 Tax=Thelazia callipaeda TaxID=103827 RepID=A0A0N5D5J4_THECL|nr:unnamed protein product [Thelazia callipaeda]